jgi:hypothetical protein
MQLTRSLKGTLLQPLNPSRRNWFSQSLRSKWVSLYRYAEDEVDDIPDVEEDVETAALKAATEASRPKTRGGGDKQQQRAASPQPEPGRVPKQGRGGGRGGGRNGGRGGGRNGATNAGGRGTGWDKVGGGGGRGPQHGGRGGGRGGSNVNANINNGIGNGIGNVAARGAMEPPVPQGPPPPGAVVAGGRGGGGGGGRTGRGGPGRGSAMGGRGGGPGGQGLGGWGRWRRRASWVSARTVSSGQRRRRPRPGLDAAAAEKFGLGRWGIRGLRGGSTA